MGWPGLRKCQVGRLGAIFTLMLAVSRWAGKGGTSPETRVAVLGSRSPDQAALCPCPLGAGCPPALSPRGLQPFEEQFDHGHCAEHAAQVQRVHALGHVEGHTGQDVLSGRGWRLSGGGAEARALLPPPAARDYLARAHVLGQLQAPAPVAVAGVAPGGVGADLLAAPLHTLVRVCNHREPLSPGAASACPIAPRQMRGPASSPGRPRCVAPTGSFLGTQLHTWMVAVSTAGSAHTGRQAHGSGVGLCPGQWPGSGSRDGLGVGEAGWDHPSPSSWRGSHGPQAGRQWEAVWLSGPLDTAGPGALGAGEKAAAQEPGPCLPPPCVSGEGPVAREAGAISHACRGGRGHIARMARRGHFMCAQGRQGPRACRGGRGHVCAGETGHVCAGETGAMCVQVRQGPRVCRGGRGHVCAGETGHVCAGETGAM